MLYEKNIFRNNKCLIYYQTPIIPSNITQAVFRIPTQTRLCTLQKYSITGYVSGLCRCSCYFGDNSRHRLWRCRWQRRCRGWTYFYINSISYVLYLTVCMRAIVTTALFIRSILLQYHSTCWNSLRKIKKSEDSNHHLLDGMHCQHRTLNDRRHIQYEQRHTSVADLSKWTLC